ncbi:hypothetical protein [Flammeovirga pacifica]|uniref:Uncharacterized protein n=1 Tax=Flammeovirga pacifica TaxID=915059 RepID=A0A1S1YVH0_FLAPC|nr:hypothetical protein [Flammeovirga pacifica]OHX65028.1 hypothetical protein NH26_01010 [Flammeovirga pacifica]
MKITKIFTIAALATIIFSCENTDKLEPENRTPQVENPEHQHTPDNSDHQFEKVTVGKPTVEDSKSIQLVEGNSFTPTRPLNDVTVSGTKIYAVDGTAFDNKVVAIDLENGNITSSFKAGNYATLSYNPSGLVVVEAGESMIELGLNGEGEITNEIYKKENPYGSMFVNYVLVDGSDTYWFDPSDHIRKYAFNNGNLTEDGTLDFELGFGMNATQDADFIYAYSGGKIAVVSKSSGKVENTIENLTGKVTLAVNDNYLVVGNKDQSTVKVYHKTTLKEMASVTVNQVYDVGVSDTKVVAYSKTENKVTVFDIQ